MSAYAWRARRPRLADLRRTALEVAFGAVAAAAVGLAIGKQPLLAFLVPAALVAVWLVVRPHAAAVAVGASLPAVKTIASGGLALHISAGDLLLLLLFLAAVGAAAVERDTMVFVALRPVAFPTLQYCVFVFLLLLAHPGFSPLLQTVQRYELIAFPLVIGSYFALRGTHVALLKAYVVAATAVAVLWPFSSLGLQKNPAGQFVANAILLVIGVPRLGRFRILVPLLIFGLFATQSRGAVLAAGVGALALVVLQWVHSPRRAVATGLAVAMVAALVFALMPPSAQTRITSYGSTGNSKAAWAVRFRKEYARDATTIAHRHPWLGVGVGSYPAAVVQEQLVPSADPHDVVLLQAAEGGWAFAGSFVLLIIGSIAVLVRHRRLELAAATVAVLLSTAVHGLVDVYWVRGTPVLGWILVGMVCATATRARREA